MPEYGISPAVSQLIEQQLATGRFRNEDELLEVALQRLKDDGDDWPAIKVALATLDAGEVGLPLKEAFQEVRQRHSPTG